MKYLYISLFHILLYYPFLATGQITEEPTSPIITDRPTQGANSPVSVPQGYLQIETGFLFSRSIYDPSYFRVIGGDPLLISSEEFPVQNFQLPDFMLKYGITDHFELRTGTGIVHSNRNSNPLSADGSPQTYLHELIVGFKYQFFQTDDSKGLLSFVAETNIPNTRTGKHKNTSDWNPEVNLVSSYSIASWFQLSANVGHSLTHSNFSPNWAVVTSFHTNKKTTIFSEVYKGRFLHEDYNHTEFRYDAGILYLLTPDLQIDFSGGLGEIKEGIVEYKYHLSAGISWRTKLFQQNKL